jgi:hypothetical protein
LSQSQARLQEGTGKKVQSPTTTTMPLFNDVHAFTRVRFREIQGSSPVLASERYITGCILVGGGNAVPDAIRAAKTFPEGGVSIPLGNNDCIYYGFSIRIISKTGIYTGTDSCAARR